MDLGEMASREAAVEQRVQLSDAGRKRPPTLLAPQRRLVGLETASAEQVLEGALALGQGRSSVAAGRETALMTFAFSSLSMIGRGAAPVNPENLVVGTTADPHPFDPSGVSRGPFPV